MYPIICSIGPFTVYAYGLAIAVAFVLSLYLLKNKAIASGFDWKVLYNLGFLVLIFGILGARLLYIFLHFDYYRDNLIEALMLQHGGLSWFGALILGSLAAIFYIRKKGLDLYQTLDLIFPFVAFGQAIGRIGCLLNGCCYGWESRLGIYFSVHNAVLIPTQIYSTISLLAIFLILRTIQEKSKKKGEVFFSYLLLYSIFRFAIEFLRAEHGSVFLGLNVFQMISIFLFCIAAWRLIKIRYFDKQR